MKPAEIKYLLVHYNDPALGAAWRRLFDGVAGVEVVEGDLCQIDCDAVVSPANSFGFMDGGLDHHLSERFGWHIQDALQKQIAARPIGELLVGESLVLPTGDARVPWLISVPTMRVPMRLRQSVNAYLAMKALLIAARDHRGTPSIRTVALPGLGTGCGALSPETAATQMEQAYREIVLGQSAFPTHFGDIQRAHRDLNPRDIVLWD